MPSATLKRKRNVQDHDSQSSHDSSDDEDTIRARFQKAFEMKFRPLETRKQSAPVKRTEEDFKAEEESDDSDWSGFGDDDAVVETVDAGLSRDSDMLDPKAEKKAFMSSKPPSSALERQAKPPATHTPTSKEDAEESTNFKNDLALQRLLKESHLLAPSTLSSASSIPETSGKSRLKALDIRLASLGAKTPIAEQVKMPLAHRKGIAAKGATREEKRRREAKESGVVLEKARAQGKEGKVRDRERSVGGPGLGKFRGGTLRLSGRDVKEIQGKDVGGRGKGKGRRKG